MGREPHAVRGMLHRVGQQAGQPGARRTADIPEYGHQAEHGGAALGEGFGDEAEGAGPHQADREAAEGAAQAESARRDDHLLHVNRQST